MFFLSLFLIGACFGSFMLSGGALTSRAFFVVGPFPLSGCHQPLQLYELIQLFRFCCSAFVVESVNSQ